MPGRQEPSWLSATDIDVRARIRRRDSQEQAPPRHQPDRGQDEEVRRLLDLGAHRADVAQGPDVSWVVITDPEGE
jgi:hypothetical protein